MHPYLLGRRNIYYFYNLQAKVYGIRATLEVKKKTVLAEGIFFYLVALFVSLAFLSEVQSSIALLVLVVSIVAEPR